MDMEAQWASRGRDELEQAIWRHLTGRDSGLVTRGSRSADGPSGVQGGASDSLSGAGRRRQGGRNAYAFDLWIAHLALLEQALEVAPIPWRELRADELDGLLLLRAARERFRREYHACAECGAPVKGKICSRCGAVG
jgi:hypothetical protein